MKQGGGQGIEVEVPVSKNSLTVLKSPSPFYRGWKVKDSNFTVTEDYGFIQLGAIEPKNRTRETGDKIAILVLI